MVICNDGERIISYHDRSFESGEFRSTILFLGGILVPTLGGSDFVTTTHKKSGSAMRRYVDFHLFLNEPMYSIG